MTKNYIHLVGLDPQSQRSESLSLVEGCSVIVASPRFFSVLQDCVPAFTKKRFIPVTPLKEAMAEIRRALATDSVAVIASGDPLFFGIGKRLGQEFPESLKIHPALSSAQHCFAHFSIPWEDARFISLHGRGDVKYLGRILGHHKCLILTDRAHSPDRVCRELIAFLGKREKVYRAFVAENIGGEGEHFFAGSLQEVADRKWGQLSCLLLSRSPEKRPSPLFGLIEKEIHHSRGLITKNEVRAAAIHALRPEPGDIIWDVGAGSGSVGLELSRLVPDSLVYAIEKNPEQLANLEQNQNEFRSLNLKVVAGEAPQALRNLPAPDKIFVGGSGGNLESILTTCCSHAKDGGRVVVTAVIEKTRNLAPEILTQLGYSIRISTVSVTRKAEGEKQDVTFNPISIITGSRTGSL